MIKILSVEKIREADKFTIQNEPIASIDLMERAGSNCADWLMERVPKQVKIKVLVGQGNNGGDGLVIARKLRESGYHVSVYIIKFTDKYSIDFSKNFDKIEADNSIELKTVSTIEDFDEINEGEVIIDSIFGSGLTRPIKGFIAEVVKKVNESEAVVVSIDMPSGLFADNPIEEKDAEIIKADFTLSLQFPKLSFLFPENEIYVGIVEIIPIGLHPVFIAQVPQDALLLDFNTVKPLIQHRSKFAHKGNFGHALLISGSYGRMGAAVLSSKACLKSGVGLLTTHIPHTTTNILQTAVPEAMLTLDKSEVCFSEMPDISIYNAIGIGPAIGSSEETAKALKLLIQEAKVPLVLDADALNILSENKTCLSFLPEFSIITPHLKEFERLAGKWNNSFELFEKQKEFAAKHKLVVVLKGAHTSICGPNGDLYFNSTGNPGMATAGSGDVLTGIILALRAQNYHPIIAAVIGVYMHGLAGDLALESESFESLTASDIINYLGEAFIYNPNVKQPTK